MNQIADTPKLKRIQAEIEEVTGRHGLTNLEKIILLESLLEWHEMLQKTSIPIQKNTIEHDDGKYSFKKDTLGTRMVIDSFEVEAVKMIKLAIAGIGRVEPMAKQFEIALAEGKIKISIENRETYLIITSLPDVLKYWKTHGLPFNIALTRQLRKKDGTAYTEKTMAREIDNCK